MPTKKELFDRLSTVRDEWRILRDYARKLIAAYQAPGVVKQMAERFVTEYNSFETDETCRKFNLRLGKDLVTVYHHRVEAEILMTNLIQEGYQGGGRLSGLLSQAESSLARLKSILKEFDEESGILPLDEFLVE